MNRTHKEKVKTFIDKNRHASWYNMPATTLGIWRICGEDPNCDFGGCHSDPYLETVEGRLHDVIDYAVELPNFWGWGAGGTVELITVKKIDKKTVEIHKHKLNQIKSLQAAIKQLEETL